MGVYLGYEVQGQGVKVRTGSDEYLLDPSLLIRDALLSFHVTFFQRR
jgi:hypothetical protein